MLFDEVIVCVFTNSAKNTMFTPEERYEFLCAVADNYRNVRADLCTGLLADYAIEHRCDVIIKGARSGTDFDYEFVGEKSNILQMSLNVSFKDGIKKEEWKEIFSFAPPYPFTAPPVTPST